MNSKSSVHAKGTGGLKYLIEFVRQWLRLMDGNSELMLFRECHISERGYKDDVSSG